jgi:tetratricopeptide (TPR) repeat protein
VFEQGVVLLHAFAWEEATQAFRNVAERDGSCLMAYWGLAMTLRLDPFGADAPQDNLRQGWAAVGEALGLDAGTPRERDYLEAIAAYYRDFDQLDHRARSLTYEVKMRELAQRYPDDLEATVFHARAAAVNAIAVDTTLERRREIGRMLDSLFEAHPEHPGIPHYIIKVYDTPELAHLGLDAARRYGVMVPTASHAQHIASHIFAHLGMWDETVAANLTAIRDSQRLEVAADSVGRRVVRLHAMDYLIYAYLQQGRDSEARAFVRHAHSLDRESQSDRSAAWQRARAAVPARYALERHDWVAAAALAVHAGEEVPSAEAITRFARALGAVREGDLETTRAEFDALLALERSLPPSQALWRRTIEAQRLAVSAWVALAEGDTTNALLLAAEAADRQEGIREDLGLPGQIVPTRELQADLLVEISRFEDAGAAYEAVLQRAPNRARSIFGAAWAAQLAGDHDAAADWYRRFLTLMAKGDGDRPELTVAEAYVRGYAQKQ